MNDRMLIFGAGALSLGFLGPMLAGAYELVFCDLEARRNVLDCLRSRNRYLVNLCSDAVVAREVAGVTGLNLAVGKDRAAAAEILRETRVVFTAVGAGGIDRVLDFIQTHREAGRAQPQFVFLAENDKNVLKRWAPRFGAGVRLVDTIMGRMCRIERAGAAYRPLAPGLPDAVVAEDYDGLPVVADIHRQAELKGACWQVMTDREFEAQSAMKRFAHNGAHAYLSYLGAWKGLVRLCDADAALLGEAGCFLEDEVVPALLRAYGDCLDPEKTREYARQLVARIASRTFADTVARGIRGAAAKIAVGERLVDGAKFVLENGGVPKYFCRIIAAGILLGLRDGALAGSIGRIVAEHCGIAEPVIAGSVEQAVAELSQAYPAQRGLKNQGNC